MAKTAARRHQRYRHGKRRLDIDRAEHGGAQADPYRTLCSCFGAVAAHGHGQEFARFADTPTPCSGSCCGNRRIWEGDTRQERRAPTTREWD